MTNNKEHLPKTEGHEPASATGTRLVAAGREPASYWGYVNPPVYRGSTILYPDLETFEKRAMRYPYGLSGSPTTDALEAVVTELENGTGTVLTASGLSAVAIGLEACLSAGDHLLMTDSCYQPTRRFCDKVLRRFGVDVEYYDPRIGAGIADLLRPRTQVIFLESPGSQTFEVQDVPAMVTVARQAGVTTVIDNTWATPLFLKPLEMGADVSIHAGTKYFGGHSDLLLGTVTANEELWPAVKQLWDARGEFAGPDAVWLCHRGIRTMAVRLRHQMTSGLEIARWLEARPEVAQVLHPALESHPDHILWKRDFSGATSLFTIVLEPGPRTALAALVDGLRLFGIGASWGGYESLALPFDPRAYRTATEWTAEGPAIRLHIGLEDTADLIGDLEAGFARWRETGGAC